MRLLFVSHQRDIAGGEICLQRIIERLQGHFVLVILPEGAFSRRLAEAGIAVHLDNALMNMTRYEDPYAFVKLAARFPGLVLRLARKIREFNADLVISNAFGPLIYAGPAARWSGVPNLCIHHHPVLKTGSTNAKLVFLLSKFCDGFITVSDAMNRGLRASGVAFDRIKTIYNGLDVDQYSLSSVRSNFLRASFNLPAEVKLIGLVGSLYEAKGHHVAIEAARLLRDEFHIDVPWRMIFIGEVFENSRLGTDYKIRLQKQIADSHLQDKIIFAGKQSQMRDVYADLDIVLNASVEPEPLGTTIYEAMAVGKIAIASDLGGSPEIISNGKTGFLVPPGHSQELAAVLEKILRGKVDIAPILLAARRKVEESFDLRETVRQYISYFESYAKKT